MAVACVICLPYMEASLECTKFAKGNMCMFIMACLWYGIWNLSLGCVFICVWQYMCTDSQYVCISYWLSAIYGCVILGIVIAIMLVLSSKQGSVSVSVLMVYSSALSILLRLIVWSDIGLEVVCCAVPVIEITNNKTCLCMLCYSL